MSKVELDAFNETRTCTYKTIVLQQFKIYVYTFYVRELLYQIKIKWKINVYKVNIMIVTPQFKYFKYGILFYFTTKFRIFKIWQAIVLPFVFRTIVCIRFPPIWFRFGSFGHRTSVSSAQTTPIWRKVTAKVIENSACILDYTNMADFKRITVDWTAPTIQPFCGPPP